MTARTRYFVIASLLVLAVWEPLRGQDLGHFELSWVTNRQYAGVGFGLTITARDPQGNVVSNFPGPVNLRGDAPTVPGYFFGFEEGVHRTGNASPWEWHVQGRQQTQPTKGGPVRRRVHCLITRSQSLFCSLGGQ